ncbi:MAG TPA: NAD(P)/FAD-dependent oxidoreductase [Chloroflexi bacterium]|nr:NAD(P)/FAD-dependent oxidoreductase [Chloroflexota bacterium]
MRVAIVGGGMTGMSAADELAQRGIAVTLFEKDASLGGLAGSFEVNGIHLEKFYHHLFTSDTGMVALIRRLGLEEKLQWLPTSNSYYVNRIYRLSTPLDLLRFSHISILDRVRVGLLYLRTMFVNDWHPLEEISARDWLVRMAGEGVYRGVWEPLLRTKFGRYADQVAAVWIWNKLKLRGSSRGKKQEERLGYLHGGFAQVVEAWERRLRDQNVKIRLSTPVERVTIEDAVATGVVVNGEHLPYDRVLVTTAPELLTHMAPDLPDDYRRQLTDIDYLANVCLVMELDRSLSNTYWLNIGDPTIPFTGVIEHTNMQRPEDYGGAHLTYISRYLDADDPAYTMSAEDLLDSYVPYLQRMFRGFQRDWVQRVWAWRERYTQPVIGLHYSQRKPPFRAPVQHLWHSCMAHIYPEDRGMNYAVLYGQRVVDEMLSAERER